MDSPALMKLSPTKFSSKNNSNNVADDEDSEHMKVFETAEDPEAGLDLQPFPENSKIYRAIQFFKTWDAHFYILFSLIYANVLIMSINSICPYKVVDDCVKKVVLPNVARWAIHIITASLIFTLLIVILIKSKNLRLYLIAVLPNMIYLGFYYNSIFSGTNYGQIVGTFFIVFIVLNFLACGIAALLKLCYKKNRLATLLGLPSLFLALGLIFYFTHIYGACDHWAYGLAGEKIIDGPQTGIIRRPSFCAYEATNGWFDFSRYMSACSASRSSPKILDQFYPKTPYVGFARTERFDEEERETLQRTILSRTVGLTDIVNDPKAADLEIFLNKTTSNDAHFIIQVKKNQSLIDERAKSTTKSLTENIIVVYIDALSRTNAFRMLPKTMKWFGNFTENKDPTADTYQFFKYHAITPYTTNNMYAALFGVYPNDKTMIAEVKEGKRPEAFLEDYKKAGFITGHASDYCQPYSLDINAKQDVLARPFDHEGLSFACDPTYLDPISPYGLNKGPYASTIRCLYGKNVFDYVYEYGNQFWDAYKDQKKMLYLEFLDAHEGTNEVVKYMDDALHEFLYNLKAAQKLEDTTVVFYSDHGLHMQGIFYLLDFEQTFIEISLPTLFILFPKDLSKTYGKNITENAQRLVSSLDIHYTFVSLAEGENSTKIEKSLFSQVPLERTCKDIRLNSGLCVISYENNKI